MKNRYFVIAKHWDTEKEKQVEFIAGEFDDFICAKLFKDAYNDHYSANARIEDCTTLLNK